MHNLETSQCDVSTEERESENSPALLFLLLCFLFIALLYVFSCINIRKVN